MEPLTILLVEAHEEVRRLMTGWLEKKGHTVTAVETPREALAACRPGMFKLVSTQLITKEGHINGLELIRQLRQADPEIRAVLTSSDEEDLKIYEQAIPEHTDATYYKGDNPTRYDEAIEKAMSGTPR